MIKQAGWTVIKEQWARHRLLVSLVRLYAKHWLGQERLP